MTVRNTSSVSQRYLPTEIRSPRELLSWAIELSGWIALLLLAAAIGKPVAVAGSELLSGGPAKANLAQTTKGRPTLHAEEASSAAAFVDSIGVQTHMSYVDTPYANWQRVLAALQRLGIHHVRDALPLNPAFLKGHQQLAAAGIRCTCGFGFDQAITAEKIIQTARAASDVEALEAPNECDAGTNCGGGGTTGIARVTALLPMLADAGHALQVPVIGPSFTRGESYAATGSIAHSITDGNLHVYFGGRNPGTEGWGAGDRQGHRYGSFDWWIDQSRVDAAEVPALITETGYEAFDNPTRAGTIPLDVESTYLLRTLLLASNHGIRRTFIYELLDEFPGSGYGLLRHDFSEKPAFAALKNLVAILQETAPARAPGRLSFSIDNGDPSLAHALFQKADGSYYLILWLERSSYDADSLHRISVPSEEAQLQLEPGHVVKEMISFNADGSTQVQRPTTPSSSLPLEVNDRLLVLRIDAH